MSDDYTPTEGQMETAWCQYAHAVDASLGRLREDDENPSDEYARFIAKVKADAWMECAYWHAEQGRPVAGSATEHNPYRKEAGL